MRTNRKPDPEKYCGYCRKLMTRKRYNGVLESMNAFLRRKYCDRVCMAKSQEKKNANLSAIRKRAAKYRGEKCENCGTIKNLGVHHRDRNPKNNTATNIQTLCSSCHTKIHWNEGKTISKKKNFYCRVCGMPARKLDMCQKHYQRFVKYGDPLLTKKKIGSRYELVREILSAESGPTSHE